MLPRRHIRIKVFQSLYALTQQPKDIEFNINKEFDKNLNAYLQLYNLMIDLLIQLKEIAIEEINLKKQKLIPSKEDLKPNQKFIKNSIFNKLKKPKYTTNTIEHEKQKSIIKQIFKNIKKSKTYIEYMSKKSISKKDEKKIIMYVFKKYFISNEQIHDFLEERSIYWNDDIIVVYNFFTEKINNNLSLNNIKLFRKKEDQVFANNLIKKTVNKEGEIISIIHKLASNWDKDRIAISDLILMRMAMIEMLYLKDIPYKVTLDEYIEISKEYSSPKSKEFINGILDVFIKEILKKKIQE